MSKRHRGVGDGLRSRAKGMVWKKRGCWYMMVLDSTEKIVNMDNVNDWQKMFDRAFEATGAVRMVENMGHELIRDYDYLVEHARGF